MRNQSADHVARTTTTHSLDNGPEYSGHTLHAWAKQHHIQLEFIQRGRPEQNAYVERYNRTVRYDWLSRWLFELAPILWTLS